LFMSERSTGVKRAFYDTKWNKLRYESEFRRNDNEIPKPENLDELIELAQKLAKGFPMVRVDFYRQNDGSIYFGEMTFTPASGKGLWSYKGQNEEYGALIKLPKPYVQPARKPAVSVIVTLYASREQACSCIEALMLQTLSPMEILCMDDSVDEVLSKALQEYAQKDDRVRIISCALGASAARNTGLEEARGDFVAFVNADQMVHPEYMKDMCARIAQQRADIVICGGQAFSGAEERVTQSGANAMNALLLNKNCFDAAEIKLTELGSDPHSIYGKMFRRCYLQRIGLQFRGIRAQDDICFAVSALMQCERITIAEKAARVTVRADDEPIAYVHDLLLLAEEMGGRDCDMLWQLCLCELKRTDAEHYAMMYHALKEEGLAQLGLEQAEEKDFRSRVYYRQIRAMLDKPVIIQFD